MLSNTNNNNTTGTTQYTSDDTIKERLLKDTTAVNSLLEKYHHIYEIYTLTLLQVWIRTGTLHNRRMEHRTTGPAGARHVAAGKRQNGTILLLDINLTHTR